MRAPSGWIQHRSRRARRIRLAAVAYLVAVALTLALTTPWDGGQDPARPVADRPARRGAPAARPPRPETPRERRPRAGRYPRAQPSTDPLAPPGPVPAAPRATVVAILGRCCSEPRPGTRVDAIVLHTTEFSDAAGPRDLVALARFFRRAGLATQAADDADGLSSRMVADERMAYHATYWNPTTVGIEQMGFAAFSRAQWLGRGAQLEATARWIAHWARAYRIPIRRCTVAGIRYNRRDRVIAGMIVRRGVCSHAQLDPRNRDDPGPGYPWGYVLSRARAIAGRAR
jgi:N-acetylmuramoyl-L-alanine amidase-like protein